VRAEYHALKERLAGESASREAYTAGKSEFVLAGPFAKPPVYDRYLRSPDGWSRR
jgi:hypothetical protein